MSGSSILVVGGGPAGLTAALGAARNGHQVRLVEAAERVGGMSASTTVAGLRVDLGSHRLHPVATPRVEALLQELLGDDLQVRPRNGRLRLHDSWVRFPLKPADLVKSLPPRFAAAALGDTVLGPVRRRRRPRRPATEADTFAAVVRDGLGPTMLDSFYGPYATKLWGRSADQLAGELARRRIAASSPGQLVAKVARAARRTPIVFRSPRLGYGQVVERLEAAGLAAGVEIAVSARVERLDLPDQGAESASVRATIDGDVGEFDHVWWTAPVAGLRAAVANPPTPAPGVMVQHRAMVLVYLVFDGPPVTQYDAHYLPGVDVLATRVSEPRNYRDGPDPDDVTVLCAEIPCFVGDETWEASSDELGAAVLADLHRLGITDRVHVATEVRRLPHVYPVVGPDDVAPLAALQAWGHSLPGVAVFGRQGLTVADNLHHVMEMGLAAAERLGGAAQQWDHEGWAADLRAFADHVVED